MQFALFTQGTEPPWQRWLAADMLALSIIFIANKLAPRGSNPYHYSPQMPTWRNW